jgi:phenylpropionate dioxygenase-like ring-hydroxylating dioxygenase large terminal subunit
MPQRAYPTVERYGLVWAFNGPRPLFPPPGFNEAGPEPLRTTLGRPVRLGCPWYAVAANAFDLQHLRAVHQRVLREEPALERLDGFRLRFRYVSRVTGVGVANRAVRRLSGDHIHVSITCWGGAALSVESRLGGLRSRLLLGLSPSEGGASTWVHPVFAVHRRGDRLAEWVHAIGTRWLFTAFLERDIHLMDGMRFAPRWPLAENEPLRQFLDLLDRLPGSDCARDDGMGGGW